MDLDRIHLRLIHLRRTKPKTDCSLVICGGDETLNRCPVLPSSLSYDIEIAQNRRSID